MNIAINILAVIGAIAVICLILAGLLIWLIGPDHATPWDGESHASADELDEMAGTDDSEAVRRER